MHFLFFVSAFTGFLIRTGQAGIQEFKVSNRSNVTAGEPTQVTLLLGEDAPEAKYQIFNYTVGLYSAAGNWPICACFCKCCLRILVLTMNPGNLISLPMTQTVFNITIPPSIGPTGYLYRLWISVYASNGQQLSTDGERYTPASTSLAELENSPLPKSFGLAVSPMAKLTFMATTFCRIQY